MITSQEACIPYKPITCTWHYQGQGPYLMNLRQHRQGEQLIIHHSVPRRVTGSTDGDRHPTKQVEMSSGLSQCIWGHRPLSDEFETAPSGVIAHNPSQCAQKGHRDNRQRQASNQTSGTSSC